ncbi:MAG: hypothetical protein GWP06_04230 [Actinobacteria bacterium]|nr:hypothetical protein [Actinomycetota bacterium]
MFNDHKKVVLLFILFCFVVSPAFAQDAGKVINQVQKKYESLKGICAEFTQTFTWKLVDETQVVKGKICVKDGVQFDIDTKDQRIISDGKTIWTVNKVNKQVIVDNASNKTEDNPFLKDFLDKFVKNYSAKIIKKEGGKSRQIHITLTSKTQDEFIRRVELWVNSKTNLISKIEQIDVNGNSTLYQVKNINTKVVLSPKDFKLDLPQGYELIDLR